MGATRGALLLAPLVLSACLAPVPPLPKPAPGEPPRVVHLVRHGWHAGIVIAREDLPRETWPAHPELDEARHLEVGWGDRAFYQARDVGLGLALRAAFGSEGSALHVAGFDPPPWEYFRGAEILRIELSPRGLEALGRFIAEEYARDAAGRPRDLGPGLYPRSRFYAALGRYHLLRTCNTWVAEALRAAGCAVSPGWAVTAGSLMRQAERCGRPVAPLSALSP